MDSIFDRSSSASETRQTHHGRDERHVSRLAQPSHREDDTEPDGRREDEIRDVDHDTCSPKGYI